MKKYSRAKLRPTNQCQAGFTLLESVVTISVFAVLVSIVGSVFISSLTLQRRATNIQQVQENSSFLLESITKSIRVSTITTPDTGANCITPSANLTIIHPVDGTVVYSLANGTDLQMTVNGVPTIINSNTIQFASLRFCVSGQASGDQLQPRVTLIASIRSTNSTQPATINIQTTTSQRVLGD